MSSIALASSAVPGSRLRFGVFSYVQLTKMARPGLSSNDVPEYKNIM